MLQSLRRNIAMMRASRCLILSADLSAPWLTKFSLHQDSSSSVIFYHIQKINYQITRYTLLMTLIHYQRDIMKRRIKCLTILLVSTVYIQECKVIPVTVPKPSFCFICSILSFPRSDKAIVYYKKNWISHRQTIG